MAKRKNTRKEKLAMEIELPSGVAASHKDRTITIKGAKGEVARYVKQRDIKIKVENNKITIETERASKKEKKLLGSLQAHIKNMIRGSQQNHTYTLKICSGHFPMNVSVSGSRLTVKNFLGEKVPRTLELKNGAEVKVEGDMIHVTSPSKEIAGQISADIEQLTRRPGFDTRIFQDGIHITVKDGRQLK